MSTSIVHVLTVIGNGAKEVEAACEQLLAKRVERHPTEYGSDDWSERDLKAIEDLCSALIEAARDLPVVYYAQYIDAWSVADSRFRLLEWPDGRRRQIYGSGFGMAFYPSTFCQDILAQIKRFRRRRLYRNQAEDRWFLDQMKEAIEAALWLRAPFLVVSISQCLGPSREDEEIKAALDTPLGLARRCQQNRHAIVGSSSKCASVSVILEDDTMMDDERGRGG
jgi:hypothetical protein